VRQEARKAKPNLALVLTGILLLLTALATIAISRNPFVADDVPMFRESAGFENHAGNDAGRSSETGKEDQLYPLLVEREFTVTGVLQVRVDDDEATGETSKAGENP